MLQMKKLNVKTANIPGIQKTQKNLINIFAINVDMIINSYETIYRFTRI